MKKEWPTPVCLAGFGEMLPRYENYVEILHGAGVARMGRDPRPLR